MKKGLRSHRRAHHGPRNWKRNPDHALFGAVLRAKREELGLTQRSLGSHADRSPSWISRYERGRFWKIPALFELRVVCSELGLNPVELLYECGFLGAEEIHEFAQKLRREPLNRTLGKVA